MDAIINKNIVEHAILVGMSSPVLGKDEDADWDTLDELEELLQTAGGTCDGKILQKKDSPDVRTFIGEGKVEEVKQLAAANESNLVVFDNDLSPSQIRNLEKSIGLPVIDRTALILDIFAQRAQTSEGRLQVELAQYQYILSKLSGIGKSMSRLGGGIGTRGPGESKLETDRRHIRRHIDNLQQEFEKIRRVRGVQREKRIKSEVPVVAIVGYTNAGKSTLLNALTGSDIQANDRLFDTLDPTARKLLIDENTSIILTDTVGFIRKLPHKLIEAFKATLEELEYADLILHVIDISNPAWENQVKVVDALIEEFDIARTPQIRVYNKCDKTTDYPIIRDKDVLISAKMGTNLDKLLNSIRDIVSKKINHILIELPYAKSAMLDLFYREAKVAAVEYKDDYISAELFCLDQIILKLNGIPYRNMNGCENG